MPSVAEPNTATAGGELFPGIPYSPELAAIAILLQSPEGVERLTLALNDPALVRDPDDVPYVEKMQRAVAAYGAGQQAEAHARRRVRRALKRYGVAR